MVIPARIRASIMLRRVEIEDKIRRSLILSKLYYEKKDKLYDQMEAQVLEVLGGGPGVRKKPQYTTNKEAVLDTGGQMTEEDKQGPPGTKWGDRADRLKDNYENLLNNIGLDGKLLTCFNSKSEYHLANQCGKKKGKGNMVL